QADSLSDIRCRNPPECEIFKKCFMETTRNQSCSSVSVTTGGECHDRFPCLQVPRVFPQGIAVCMAKHKTIQQIDFHFYGLDYKFCKYT
ncbi:unnamed protein product, partial [Allacma fusca]